MRKLLAALILMFLMCGDLYALHTIKEKDVYIYYPEGCREIAETLASKVESYEVFLTGYGLTVPKPLHIIIDEKKDYPGVSAHIIPHFEIRIPIRAPGVLEEGYLEDDPWSYFMFKGMCLEAVYVQRSGIPQALHYAFGQVVSPNAVMAPWFDEGFSYLMYSLYNSNAQKQDPFENAIFKASMPVDIAKLSNHPGIWPGHYAYRIFGRPFIFWVYERYGMDKLLEFIKLHGQGILIFDIDLKAKKVFGKSWHELWLEYMSMFKPSEEKNNALFIQGYWPKPFIYWNYFGVYPGVERRNACGRYGYYTKEGLLWIDEYDLDGSTHLVSHRGSITNTTEIKHVWNPGEGDIAVTRKAHVPYLVSLKETNILGVDTIRVAREYIKGPAGAIQMSGPQKNHDGRIAVSVNIKGNWDIWVYDGSWKRLTDSPSIELDPWWDNDRIVFSSNISGKFQLMAQDMTLLTNESDAALMPRAGKYLRLVHSGWKLSEYKTPDMATFYEKQVSQDIPVKESMNEDKERGYNPLNSIMPNWMMPDIYADTSDVQLGLVTSSRDVTKDYLFNAGFRYSFSEEYISARIGGSAKGLGVNFSRYPLDYSSDMARVDESRYESKLYFRPIDDYKWFEISANWLNWEDRDYGNDSGDDIWGAISLNKVFGSFSASGAFEHYSGGMNSLYGTLKLRAGKEIFTVLSLSAGRSWGDYTPGHGSYRMGGDVGEGYFTRRPSRLYPLRGFSSNTFEAGQVYTAGGEVYWPIANIQKGYGTMPLFLHRLKLGTFVDSGLCSDEVSTDDIALGAGLELVTSMEIAWGVMSEIRLGLAWPIIKPDYINPQGYVVLFQIGRPL